MLLEALKENLNPFYSVRQHGFLGFVMTFFLWAVIGLFAGATLALTYDYWKTQVFNFHYAPTQSHKVKVSKKHHYTTLRHYSIMVGKVLVPQTETVHHYEVSLSGPTKQVTLDHYRFYNKVEVDQKGVFSYQEEYRKFKWEDKFSFNKNFDYQFNGKPL